jgi:hypothetical protein
MTTQTPREALAAAVPLVTAASAHPSTVAGGRTVRWTDPGGDVTLELLFQLSIRGTGTRSVPLIPHVRLLSRSLARWRRSEGLPPDRGSVMGTALGLLSPRAQGIGWEIGEPNRAASAVDIARTVDERARPLLDLLADPDAACPALAERWWAAVPGVDADLGTPPVEYLLCHGRADLVPVLLATVERHPRSRRFLTPTPEPTWLRLARSLSPER